MENKGHGAYNTALVFESASDFRFSEGIGEYHFTRNELEYFARIVAYKVANNLKNGFTMDPELDPLTYVDCDK